jgi:uncharacterized protein YjdB
VKQKNLYYILSNPEQATEINVSQKAVTLKVGKSLNLSAVMQPVNCVDSVSWKSGDETIATVNSNGKVTAKAPGECLIIATTGSGQSDACKVTVIMGTVGKVTSLKATSKKSGMQKIITLTWKKVSGADGYEWWYSYPKAKKYQLIGTTENTNVSITVEKKYKYRIKIRAYKMVNGEKVYGKFSKVVKK